MPVDNLLRPDNRLLGSGTGDFSVYGGQPNPAVTFPHPGDVAAAATESAPTADDPGTAPDARLAVDDGTHAAPQAADTSSPVARSSQHDDDAPTGRAAQPQGDHDTAPAQPVGSGSTPPDILTHPTAPAPDGSSVAADTAPTQLIGDHAFATTAPVLSEIAGVASVTAHLAQVDATISAVTGLADNLASDAFNAVDTTVGTVGDTLGQITDTATGIVDNLVQTPVHDIDPLIFTGIDPAGGIATLVDLVQTSELFTVGQSETPAELPGAGGSIVDDLIGDAATQTPILGDHDASHDPAHDALGGHDLHLGL